MSALFIRRPIMTTLVMLSILLFGVIGYRKLPVSDLPNVDYPTISVNASFPGANADTMAATVATPLEKEFSTIAGVDSMSSQSSMGQSQIMLQFVLSRNIDAAAQDVQAAIARAQRQLPSQMTTPPSYRKANPGDMPILYLALKSAAQPMSRLDYFGQTTIAQQISMIDGVAQVQVYGSQKRAVRVKVDPLALAARGFGLDEVGGALDQQNVNLPLGILSGARQSMTVQANGQLMDPERFESLLVAYRNGQPVRLGDLAKVEDSVENDRIAAWFCTPTEKDRAIVLAVQRQPGTNTVEVAAAVKAKLNDFRQQLPASVSLEILRDSSEPIIESFDDVRFTLVLTLVLVVLVIFLFLRNVRATIIPSLTLPMAIVGTFAVMWLLDYSLDNLSLMAITLSVGFVVDDAIVMLENIYRHMEMGKGRLQASFDGAKEIGFTIISMTISLAAVFIPVLFMEGIVGRLFREFSVTIGVAVLVSGVVSLSLTPMLASRFLADEHQKKHGLLYRAIEASFEGMRSFYALTLRGVLRHRRITMLFSLGILGLTVYMYMDIPKDFLPPEDRGQIRVRTEGAQDISFQSMVDHHMALADAAQKDPAVEKFMCSVGGGGGMLQSNTGFLFLVLKNREQRDGVDAVIDRLRPKFAAVPGMRASPTNPPVVQMGKMAPTLYMLTLTGSDTQALYRYGQELERQVRELPGFQDVSSDLLVRNKQLNVEIDRENALKLGVTARQVEEALYSAYGTRQVSTIYTTDNQYQVILEVQPEYQSEAASLAHLYVRSSGGQLVPLKAVTRQSEGVGPLTINHTGQLPSVTIFFNLKAGVSLSQAVEDIRKATEGKVPDGVASSFQGTAQAFQDSLKSMPWLMGLAVVVIYIVLGILYENFLHPLTILSALPFAGVGAFLALELFHVSLSMYAFVGIIMLIGLVKKNGIMMVDFAIEAQRTEGKSPRDAIYEACLVRFRPIMMTTMAALMAGLPIAMGYGAGAEARRPLGLAVVGGLIFSQTLTLYVTPVFYLYMEKLRQFLSREKAVPSPQPA